MVKAVQNMWKKESEAARIQRASDMTFTGSAGKLAAMMDEMQNMEELDMPMVKIGDASVASPFTSKMPSIRGTLDIIRQVLQIYLNNTFKCVLFFT
jgi:cation-transporting ATPase 13A1